MIYYFSVKNEVGVDVTLFLSADNHRQLYNRILFTYGIPKDKVTILAEYKETGVDGYELIKSFIEAPEEKEMDQKIIDKAKQLIRDKKYRTGDAKEDYIKRHNLQCSVITGEKDLYPLIEKYKIVKVYFEPGEKRGTKVHYAVYK